MSKSGSCVRSQANFHKEIHAGKKNRLMFPSNWFLRDHNSQKRIARVACPFPVNYFHEILRLVMFSVTVIPVSHCVPLKPDAQLQLNPFTRSVQVSLFLQGCLAQSSISV